MTELPFLVGLSDLAERWQRSREYVRLHMRDADDFPAPAGSINGGRNRFWLASDLEAYEARHPSVLGGTAGAPGERRQSSQRVELSPARRPAPRPEPQVDRAEPAPDRTDRPAQDHPPELRAAIEQMRQREIAKSEGHTPVAFVLAFTFEQKPPFEFRERLKRQGWTYSPKDREWVARVRPQDADDWRSDFETAGARKVYDEPRYE